MTIYLTVHLISDKRVVVFLSPVAYGNKSATLTYKILITNRWS